MPICSETMNKDAGALLGVLLGVGSVWLTTWLVLAVPPEYGFAALTTGFTLMLFGFIMALFNLIERLI